MDKASFETLFKELYVKLYYYALQLIHDEEASKDIVSGMFCELLEIYETLDSATLPTYLYRTVRNKCIDHLRPDVIKAAYADYYLNAVEYCYVDEDAGSLEKERCVEEMLASLPDQTSYILKQCFLHKKKYKDVAEELGVCQDTVKRHIMRALKSLRKLYSRKKD